MCGDLFGGGSPEVDYEPTEVVDDQKKSKTLRSMLLKTAGGIKGEELAGGQTAKRDTIFGNA